MSLYRKARPDEALNTLRPVISPAATVPPVSALVNTVNTTVSTTVSTDRHKPGYMRDYMRTRRAEQKAKRDAVPPADLKDVWLMVGAGG